ncbi:HNH endonuclease [Demequina silvatica]|uniref:HNH endonuclease n=1 Tax=Demequina silvatica TaxID=1638988 RepID=UPI0007847827|nr:HNH endonuclease signature motif containing protein [Demequina silvatica]
MEAAHLFDDLPGGSGAGFASACVDARVAVGTMRSLASVGGSPDAVDRLGAAAQIVREMELVIARTARDIEVQSDVPGGGLAKHHGFRSAADLVASKMGTHKAEAFRLLEIGKALEERENGKPDPGPDPDEPNPDEPEENNPDDPNPDEPEENNPPDPQPQPQAKPQLRYRAIVTEALHDGLISAKCGAQILVMLDSLSEEVTDSAKEEAAAELVKRAHGLDAYAFAKIVQRFKAALDVEQHERTEAQKRRARYLKIWDNSRGMVEIHGELDAETAAPLRAAIDKMVGDQMRRSRDVPGEDLRSSEQMRADSLADLARHALGCETTTAQFANVSVVIRATAADLESGTGLGELDGCTQPIGMTTVGRMITSAILIPALIGDKGQVLKLGRRIYPFSHAQRIALGERDGGCAKCGAPPAWTEAHHIIFWAKGGPTNLANGALLCSHCHHVIHDEGWQIRATDTEIWFIPPASVDPQRTPWQGGRARFGTPRPWNKTTRDDSASSGIPPT